LQSGPLERLGIDAQSLFQAEAVSSSRKGTKVMTNEQLSVLTGQASVDSFERIESRRAG
jgi:hypothetical protein